MWGVKDGRAVRFPWDNADHGNTGQSRGISQACKWEIELGSALQALTRGACVATGLEMRRNVGRHPQWTAATAYAAYTVEGQQLQEGQDLGTLDPQDIAGTRVDVYDARSRLRHSGELIQGAARSSGASDGPDWHWGFTLQPVKQAIVGAILIYSRQATPTMLRLTCKRAYDLVHAFLDVNVYMRQYTPYIGNSFKKQDGSRCEYYYIKSQRGQSASDRINDIKGLVRPYVDRDVEVSHESTLTFANCMYYSRFLGVFAELGMIEGQVLTQYGKVLLFDEYGHARDLGFAT